MIPANHACPLCGYHTLEERFNQEICLICFWEDDTEVNHNEDSFSKANKLSVSDAQVNFILNGVVDLNYAKNVRIPTAADIRQANWKPTQKAQEKLAGINPPKDLQAVG